MTITDRAARVLQQIDEALALAEKATPGPWIHDKSRETIGDVTTEDLDGIAQAQERIEVQKKLGRLGQAPQRDANAAFIAASRTGWPIALRCLKTAIEGLLWMLNGSWGHEVCDNDARGCAACERAEKDLATLCDRWEARR